MDNGTTERFELLEAKLEAIERKILEVVAGHEFFMQTLEDAAAEIAANTMTRVMLPEKMRQSLDTFLELRKVQRAKNVTPIEVPAPAALGEGEANAAKA